MNSVKALESHGQAFRPDFRAHGVVAKSDFKKLIDTDAHNLASGLKI